MINWGPMKGEKIQKYTFEKDVENFKN